MKKILGYLFVALIVCFVFKNWDKLTDMDKLLNNVVNENNNTNEVVDILQNNDAIIINHIDSLSNSINNLNKKVDTNIKSVKNELNDLRVEIDNINERDNNFHSTNWHYYRSLDKISGYYKNICHTTSDCIDLYDNSVTDLTLRVVDSPKKITISLSNGEFKFDKNNKSKIIVLFNQGFTDIRLVFNITRCSDLNNVAIINDYGTFIKHIKDTNRFVIRTELKKQIDSCDFEFQSQKTLDETTRG